MGLKNTYVSLTIESAVSAGSETILRLEEVSCDRDDVAKCLRFWPSAAAALEEAASVVCRDAAVRWPELVAAKGLKLSIKDLSVCGCGE